MGVDPLVELRPMKPMTEAARSLLVREPTTDVQGVIVLQTTIVDAVHQEWRPIRKIMK